MLILDIKTQWSLTHQMLSHALQYRAPINVFIDTHNDLHGSEPFRRDWESIAIVWLLTRNFRSATSQMSTTSKPMLSSTHSTFCGLQCMLKEKLKQLPQDAPPKPVQGLMEAHQKLSDYYYKYDHSPFYIWATCHPFCILQALEQFYPTQSSEPSANSFPPKASESQPGIINFSDFDQDDEEPEGSELECYFDALCAAPQTDPIQWWYVCKLILVQGSVVAVERIFSGGRDTISLCHAQLKPETIHVLMLYKHQLRL
ncbi:hypothetical protein BT96DRAFT_788678, partial [Gymnopus androsaceus JB14]